MSLAERNAALILLLLRARGRIATGKSRFACDAIEQAHDELTELLEEARLYAIGRFGLPLTNRGLRTAEKWLRLQGVPRRHITPGNMRAYRLRWIDSIIKELR